MIIYKTTNTITGKIYVGQDSKNNPKYLGSGIRIRNSIKKYGKNNFIKETLAEADSSEELDELEIFWIDKLNSRDPLIGYNIHSGGSRFQPMDGSTRTRISKTLIGRKLSPETCKKMGLSRKGNKHWTRQDSFNGFSKETLQKMSEAKKGKIPSKETLQKRSESLKKSWIDRDAYERSGNKNPFYGKTHSDIEKQKISVRQKNSRWVVNSNNECKKILECELENYISDGYQRGRIWKL